MKGAVAAGSAPTVQAGLDALAMGGNAVDAIVASTLMAAVAEPLLTGLGGGGMATVRMNGVVESWDMFSNAPGLEPHSAGQMRPIEVDFGSATQVFHVGPAAVAPPAIPSGLEALHTAWGQVPMSRLAEPAIEAALTGTRVTRSFARVAELLWPILQVTEASRAIFGPQGHPLREGDTYHNPDLADTLRAFADHGSVIFREGPLASDIVDAVGDQGALGLRDLQHQHARRMPALGYRYRDATVWVPGPSSVAGLLVLQSLRALEDYGQMPTALSAQQVRVLAHAMSRVEQVRSGTFTQRFFEPGFVEGFLAALVPGETGEERLHLPIPGPSKLGHTTHISAVDEAGNAAGITHSLGETSGIIVPGTGVRLNNFMGEADVNPPKAPRPAGQRLMTMCCPTILELGDQVYVMGSGGSSRIRSAILHGVVYLTDHGLDPEHTVKAPRAHMELDTLHVETVGRPKGAVEQLATLYPTLKRFDGPNMFFGGLNIAGHGPAGFSGAGDARRSGAFGTS